MLLKKGEILTLIKSISGIRGTIGGVRGAGLTPPDVVKFVAAFAHWQLQRTGNNKIVIGRDGRISGKMLLDLAGGTLQGMGMEVVDLGLSTTPTVEIAVPEEKAGGGIILTASHNPAQWNALKLLNEKGEFISAEDGREVLEIAEKEEYTYAAVDRLGSMKRNDSYFDRHIDQILRLPLVDTAAIKQAGFHVVLDAVNSTGGLVVPALLQELGVAVTHRLYCEPDGNFPHNPEPLAENLTVLSSEVVAKKAHLGIAVDPDVDRLVFVCEDGSMFGEEYTLVAVADYVLSNNPGGNTVSNLSSTMALRDVTGRHGGKYTAAAVGEVNVVEAMKSTGAVIGGEGNGGIIYPDLHYGRDALVGIALFLTHLAKKAVSVSQLRASYPAYHISKNKITLSPEMDIESLMQKVREQYSGQPLNTVDGVRIEFDSAWVHLRKSNTEPIIRIISEAATEAASRELADKIINDIKTYTE